MRRPETIKSHFVDQRAHLAGIRARCRPLRSQSYGRQLRAVIRHRPGMPIRFERNHLRA
jgi:hypothetical protein